ncbi:MAG: nuclear transport factor 2 family protein [Gammaproteobacteria bacterium]|nr:nuclear transport factor 2 family protein [Gammaproteobacteria bacterium]
MLSRYWLIALAGVVALIAVPLFLSTEEEQILEQLERIRSLAEITSAENGIQQLSRTREIARQFSAHTVFDLTSAGYGITEIPSRQELEQKILSGRNRIIALELSLDEPVVHIEGDTARVRVRGTALGSIRGEQGQFLDIHTIEVLLGKEDGDWRVSGATHLRDERQP